MHDPVRVHLSHYVAYRAPVWWARFGNDYMRRRSRRTTAGLLVHGKVPGVGILRARICPDSRNLWGIRRSGDCWPQLDAHDIRSRWRGSSGPPLMATGLILCRYRQKTIALSPLQRFEREDLGWFPRSIRDLASDDRQSLEKRSALPEPIGQLLRDGLE